MKARLFFLIGIFAFLTAMAFADDHPEIVKISVDEFMAEYAKLEDIVTAIPVKEKEVSGSRAEQKEIKKANKIAAANLKILETIEKWTRENLEKDRNSSMYPNLTCAISNTETGAKVLYIVVYGSKKENKGYWIFDGKGNVFIMVNNEFGMISFMEGPRFEELTGTKWYYIKNTSEIAAVSDKGDMRAELKKDSEWKKGFLQFTKEMVQFGSAHYSVITAREKQEKLK